MDELFTSLRSDTDRVGFNGLQVTESHCDFEGTVFCIWVFAERSKRGNNTLTSAKPNKCKMRLSTTCLIMPSKQYVAHE